MTLDDFIAKLDNDISLIERASESMSNEIAESLLTLIKDRSINEGININGDPGAKATYSTRQIKTDKFSKKVLNSGGRSYLAANIMGTWREFREAQGLPGNPVTLSYTNEMWSKIQVLTTSKTGYGKAQTTIGTYDKETYEKMEQNEWQFGPFMQPLPEEVEMAQQVQKEKILKLLRQ